MTEREILQAAITKALDNGYTPPTADDDSLQQYSVYYNKLVGVLTVVDNDNFENDIRDVIFSHDFARAFWGDEPTPTEMIDLKHEEDQHAAHQPYIDRDMGKYDGNFTVFFVPAWRLHLQQMVLQENPIEYLKQFI